MANFPLESGEQRKERILSSTNAKELALLFREIPDELKKETSLAVVNGTEIPENKKAMNFVHNSVLDHEAVKLIAEDFLNIPPKGTKEIMDDFRERARRPNKKSESNRLESGEAKKEEVQSEHDTLLQKSHLKGLSLTTSFLFDKLSSSTATKVKIAPK